MGRYNMARFRRAVFCAIFGIALLYFSVEKTHQLAVTIKCSFTFTGNRCLGVSLRCFCEQFNEIRCL